MLNIFWKFSFALKYIPEAEFYGMEIENCISFIILWQQQTSDFIQKYFFRVHLNLDMKCEGKECDDCQVDSE